MVVLSVFLFFSIRFVNNDDVTLCFFFSKTIMKKKIIFVYYEMEMKDGKKIS
jgi:hypothetical protein